MFYVYVIQSASDTGLYIGMSGDLRRRFLEHLSAITQSAPPNNHLLDFKVHHLRM
jgi:predicted GIY-YIG superfamily endonuclease